MTLAEIAERLGLQNLTPEISPAAADVTGGYVSDLLSDVLANAPKGGVLVTVQVHLNVIAVAVHAELAAIIFASDRVPDDTVQAKAKEEGIALYCSKASAFEVVGRLWEMGVRGPRQSDTK
ncbi:MAG: serine kinase [Phycisphaerae bacterium]|jgi:hypothetical protein|nr:serine kinase [Phycisphaerae bacterium]HOO17789.1 serine kinase [Phycisphaerae bacterium]HPC22780.1 serine kinase [Phycisphaerae bacterium]HRS27116.1 serine kinase [Phycisphaerae bacterium]HRT40725.1 serine kinase [Phycisphaerae bacterium]